MAELVVKTVWLRIGQLEESEEALPQIAILVEEIIEQTSIKPQPTIVLSENSEKPEPDVYIRFKKFVPVNGKKCLLN